MSDATRERLLALNRAFYATVAVEFDRTRSGFPVGWEALRPFLPTPHARRPHVLDAGCGNGRFARFLEESEWPCSYVGVDADATLLALAAGQTTNFAWVQPQFVQADLTDPGWATPWRAQAQSFDLIVCLAVLHHLPGFALRRQVLHDLASLLAVDGVLIASTWQFLTSARFAQKVAPWQQVGLDEAEVEPGDALLPWNQGVHALRYVHQIDEAEIEQLAQEAGLAAVHHFYADGKEGNLNLYAVLRPR
jgi:tRNA (uracil-5-)-methyltransferase TRM9